jgi:UDP-N-acetylmuramyl pentapeptide phosphotransferase/UDP-N-acetylglucosamine-1-phosphate transferase
MSLLSLYLVSVLLNAATIIHPLLVFLIILGVITLIIGSIAYADDYKETSSKVFSFTKKITLVICILLTLKVLVPTEKQMYLMAGAYVVTNNEQIKQLPDNMLGAANAWLKKLEEVATEEPSVKPKPTQEGSI